MVLLSQMEASGSASKQVPRENPTNDTFENWSATLKFGDGSQYEVIDWSGFLLKLGSKASLYLKSFPVASDLKLYVEATSDPSFNRKPEAAPAYSYQSPWTGFQFPA